MPHHNDNDLHETLAAVRSQIEYLMDIGLDELPMAAPPQSLPACTLDQADSARGISCRSETLEEIRSDLGDCQRCALGQTRTCLVFGVGNPAARLVLVGEAPGREEDACGEPFVGEAGQLLDRILLAMGMTRDDVYICNVLKCRPANNRDPLPEEVALCEPFLKRQLAAIAPDVIVALGRFAVQSLLQTSTPVGRLRGNWQTCHGIALMPTYHPAYLLRNPAGKRDVWEDMKQVMQRLHAAGKS